MWDVMRTRIPMVALILLFLGLPALSASGSQAYQAMGIDVGDVLTGTVVPAKVVPGGQKQVACVVTYFTGAKGKADAVNVRLALFQRRGAELDLLYGKDIGEEQGGYVARGNLELLDLDRDGVSEVIVCYDSFKEPLIEQRACEVILQEDGKFRTAWAGPVSYDATKAVRDVPKERRDSFEREFDWASTIRTRGLTLFVNKKMIAVAGQRLDEPKLVQESFPLREKPDYR